MRAWVTSDLGMGLFVCIQSRTHSCTTTTTPYILFLTNRETRWADCSVCRSVSGLCTCVAAERPLSRCISHHTMCNTR